MELPESPTYFNLIEYAHRLCHVPPLTPKQLADLQAGLGHKPLTDEQRDVQQSHDGDEL